MKTVHEFSFGIIPVFKNTNGEYLFCIIKRTTGHWSFLKGHKDDGESEEQTARREVCEEAGIKDIELVPNIKFKESYSFINDGFEHKKVVKYFLGICSLTDTHTDDRFKTEISEVRWLPFPEVQEQITFPESKKLAQEAHEYLLGNMQ